MTTDEACNELYQKFNLLWNNIASDKAPGLEKYEISVLMTQAQEALVKDYFSARSNALAEGFDDSIRRQSDFRTLHTAKALSPVSGTDVTADFNTRSTTKYYEYPDDAFLVLNEEVKVTTSNASKYYTVVPLAYDEYARLMMRPYKYPPKGQVWRLLTHTGATSSRSYQVIELIANFPVGSAIDYRMHYIKRPSPIILESLAGTGLSIEGQTAQAACMLPDHLHDEMLQRAVMLAKVAWIDSAAPAAQN
jgi:hypothetical protein